MPAPQYDKWAEFREAFKSQSESAREQLSQWLTDVRGQPELIWQTVAVRYSVYGMGGLLAVLLVRTAIGLLQPVDLAQFEAPARTAHFDVICDNASCKHHFVIERKFSFDRFPVTCPHCDQPSGQLALRCNSRTCGGKLVPTKIVNRRIVCAVCAADLGDH
jgi:hypothetical protein